jgi:hypothetical protein
LYSSDQMCSSGLSPDPRTSRDNGTSRLPFSRSSPQILSGWL